MLKVILADSHGTITGKDQNSPNLGLLYLAAYIRKHELPVEFRYLSMIKTEQDHLDLLEEWKPDIYGVSFTSYTAPRTYQMINRVKEAFPQVLVICGGSHPTAAYKDVFQKSNPDLVCIGEGEETFKELILQILAGNRTEFSSVNGLAFKVNGEIVVTPSRKVIDDLDDIPFPARDLVNDAEFCGLTYRKATPSTGLTATRGCPYRCVFCATQYRIPDGPRFRARSPENIAQEADELYQMGYREIYLYADEINLSVQWTIEVCRALAGLGHQDLYFQCSFRCEPITEELVEWLAKANLWLVHLGIESANERVLVGIRKQMSVEKTIRATQLLSKGGVKVFAFLMMFNYWEEDGRIVHETEEEVDRTIRFAYRLFRRGQLHYCTWTYAIPTQGAEFYDIAMRHGMIDDSYYPSDTWSTFDHLVGVTPRKFNQLYKRGRRQQGIMALFSGNIEWRNWRAIRHKLWTAIAGNRKVPI